ncbi:MAG: response regulator transcription factor [Syntrophomonas sp.]|nr:response regulator transcription factor [Syntrophomonas sp.]
MSNDIIKVLIVDDHNIVRDGLKLILESDDRLVVCGEAKDLQEAMDKIRNTCPDVILLDFRLPDGDGINGCLMIKRQFPKIKIIILTAYTQEHLVIETIRAGADGYLLKSVESQELINNIIKVHAGDCILDASVTEGVFNSIISPDSKLASKSNYLSLREKDILEILSQGKSNCEIAEALNISEKTVRNYISNIFKKLNVSNRTEAAMYWVRMNNLV